MYEYAERFKSALFVPPKPMPALQALDSSVKAAAMSLEEALTSDAVQLPLAQGWYQQALDGPGPVRHADVEPPAAEYPPVFDVDPPTLPVPPVPVPVPQSQPPHARPSVLHD